MPGCCDDVTESPYQEGNGVVGGREVSGRHGELRSGFGLFGLPLSEASANDSASVRVSRVLLIAVATLDDLGRHDVDDLSLLTGEVAVFPALDPDGLGDRLTSGVLPLVLPVGVDLVPELRNCDDQRAERNGIEVLIWCRPLSRRARRPRVSRPRPPPSAGARTGAPVPWQPLALPLPPRHRSRRIPFLLDTISHAFLLLFGSSCVVTSCQAR